MSTHQVPLIVPAHATGAAQAVGVPVDAASVVVFESRGEVPPVELSPAAAGETPVVPPDAPAWFAALDVPEAQALHPNSSAIAPQLRLDFIMLRGYSANPSCGESAR